MRGRLAVAAIVLWWVLGFLFFAKVPLTSPPLPERVDTLEGAGFGGAIGEAEVDGDTMKVTGADEKNGVLLVRRVDIVAGERRYLRYRLSDFPAAMELALVFRRADTPGDTFSISLTSPRGDTGTVDLSTVDDWRGRIVEIGFAGYAVAQSAPLQTAFRPYRLVDARFESPSWRGALGAAWTEWFGRRYWALMSMSALGPDAPHVRGRSLTLFIAAGLAGTIALAAFVGGRRGRRLWRYALVACFCAWLVLDLRWLVSLADRHAGTRAAYGGHDWRERQALQPDRDAAAAAARVRAELGDRLATARIIVDAPSDYERARLVYHLLPANAAPMNLVMFTPKNYPDVYVLLYGREDQVFDAEKHQVTLMDESVEPVEAVIDEQPLRLFRLKQPGEP